MKKETKPLEQHKSQESMPLETLIEKRKKLFKTYNEITTTEDESRMLSMVLAEVKQQDKETIQRIKEELKRVRKIALKLHTEGHSVNLDVKSWNDPVDGLDYALHIIDEEVGRLG